MYIYIYICTHTLTLLYAHVARNRSGLHDLFFSFSLQKKGSEELEVAYITGRTALILSSAGQALRQVFFGFFPFRGGFRGCCMVFCMSSRIFVAFFFSDFFPLSRYAV